MTRVGVYLTALTVNQRLLLCLDSPHSDTFLVADNSLWICIMVGVNLFKQ